MRVLLFTFLLSWLLFTAFGFCKDLPKTWAHEWEQKARIVISWHLPYVWGGESRAEGGYDCTGFLDATAPDIYKLVMKAKRSTSARMEKGLDGWKNRPLDYEKDDFQAMDLGFINGHAFALAKRKGLYDIVHSRSSKGPIEEPLPKWIAIKNPRFKRLTIGD